MREDLEKKIADAKHQRKSDAENAIVIRDKNGHWVCEIYTAGHTIWNGQNLISSESETK